MQGTKQEGIANTAMPPAPPVWLPQQFTAPAVIRPATWPQEEQWACLRYLLGKSNFQQSGTPRGCTTLSAPLQMRQDSRYSTAIGKADGDESLAVWQDVFPSDCPCRRGPVRESRPACRDRAPSRCRTFAAADPVARRPEVWRPRLIGGILHDATELAVGHRAAELPTDSRMARNGATGQRRCRRGSTSRLRLQLLDHLLAGLLCAGVVARISAAARRPLEPPSIATPPTGEDVRTPPDSPECPPPARRV